MTELEPDIKDHLREEFVRITEEANGTPQLKRVIRGYGFIILAVILALSSTGYALWEIRRIQTGNMRTLNAVEALAEDIESCIDPEGDCYKAALTIREQATLEQRDADQTRTDAAVQKILDKQNEQQTRIETALGTIRGALRDLGANLRAAQTQPRESPEPTQPVPSPQPAPAPVPSAPTPSPTPTPMEPPPTALDPEQTDSERVGEAIELVQGVLSGISCLVLQLC